MANEPEVTEEAQLDSMLSKLDTPVESSTATVESSTTDKADTATKVDDKTAETTAQTQEKKEPDTSETKKDDTSAVTDTTKKVEEKTEPKLYAGIFTNIFDLTHSTQELAKKLEKDNKEIIALFQEAQTSGDWTKVEGKYKEYLADFTRKNQEAKKESTPTTETRPETVSNEIIPTTWKDDINRETMLRFEQTDIARRMHALGIEIPKSEEEVNALYSQNGYFAEKFESTVKQIYSDVMEDAKNISVARKEAPGHNKQQIEIAKQQINELMTRWNASLPPEDVDKALESYLKDKTIYEDKFKDKSSEMIKPDEILRRFKADYADKLHEISTKKREAEAANKASMKTVEVLQGNKEKSIDSIGNSKVIPKSVTPKSVDLKDRGQVDSLSDEEKEKALADALEEV